MAPERQLPPACLVRGLADIEAVLSEGRPATLLSAAAAAAFLGASTWRAVVAEARRRHPQAFFVDILDCADASGRALEALRLGQRRLVLAATAPGHASIRERAAGLGATVLDVAPEAFDVGERTLLLAARPPSLASWLGSGHDTGPWTG